jgi:hypothetical protein
MLMRIILLAALVAPGGLTPRQPTRLCIADYVEVEAYAGGVLIYQFSSGPAGIVRTGPASAWQALCGQDFWVDTPEYGYFDAPPDLRPAGLIYLYGKGGVNYLIMSLAPSQPGVYYVLAFTTLEATTAADGTHLGQHPAAAVKVEGALWRPVWRRAVWGVWQ